MQETAFAGCHRVRIKGRYKCSPVFPGIEVIIKKVRLINKIAHFLKSPTGFSGQCHQGEMKNRFGCQNFDGTRGKEEGQPRQEPPCINKQYMVVTPCSIGLLTFIILGPASDATFFRQEGLTFPFNALFVICREI